MRNVACLSFCAVTLVLVIALVKGAADEPHDISSLDAASQTDDLQSLSKEQLLSFFTGQNADLKKQNAAHEMQNADLKKQNAAHEMQVADLKKQNEEQNAAHEMQNADLKKQNAAHEMRNADLKKQNAALKARLDGTSRLAAAKNDELGEQTMMQTVMMQGSYGFTGMAIAGLSTEQSSGMEKKELGEVALVSDPEPYVKSTLKYGKRINSTNGLGPSACSDPFINCNPALCEGHTPGFSGGLNCPTFTSDRCPDDLSGLSYFMPYPNGVAKCVPFNDSFAIQRAVSCRRYDTGRICTKAGFVHPHKAAEHVVAIMLKRLVCSDDPEKCFTHKMGYCISNEKSDQHSYFSSSKSFQIKTDEYPQAYKMLKGNWTDTFDTENGGIRDEWACGDEDTQIFRDVLMAF